jgi:hypothetical protein
MPSQPNGELLSYDIHLYSSSVDDSESNLATINSDQTYFALSEDQHNYKRSDSLVQVVICWVYVPDFGRILFGGSEMQTAKPQQILL